MSFRAAPALPFVEMRKMHSSSACFHKHSHDEFSFGVVDSGEADYESLGQRSRIGKGATVTINPGDTHACNPRQDSWSYRMLFVDANWLSELQQEMLVIGGQDYLPFAQRYEDDSNSYKAFDSLYRTLSEETSSLAAETCLISFLASCFDRNSTGISNGEKIDTRRMLRLKELILDRLNENISLDEFSEHAGMSRFHLIRSFKHEYGQTPHAFQLDQRIVKAKLLLKKGTSLIDTAHQLGFADQSHFQRNFKKRIAISPGQYQAFFL